MMSIKRLRKMIATIFCLLFISKYLLKTSYATEKTKHERNKKKGVVLAHIELCVRYYVNTLGASSSHPYNNSVKEVCPFYKEGHLGQVAGTVMSQAE